MGFGGWFGILAELRGSNAPSITDFFRLDSPGFNALSYCAVTDIEVCCNFCNIEIFFIHTEQNGNKRKGVAMSNKKTVMPPYAQYESERKTNKKIRELLNSEIDLDYEQALTDAHNYKWVNERMERIKSVCRTYNVDVPRAMEFLRLRGLRPL